MDQLLTQLLNTGGPLGIIAAVMIITTVVGLWVRQKGILSVGENSKLVSKDRLSSIDNQLGAIDSRLTSVESDLRNRPTREEIHALEIAVTKIDGRIDGVVSVTNATNHAVNRIEEYMLRSNHAAKGK